MSVTLGFITSVIVENQDFGHGTHVVEFWFCVFTQSRSESRYCVTVKRNENMGQIDNRGNNTERYRRGLSNDEC